jgi:hypothetical protein
MRNEKRLVAVAALAFGICLFVAGGISTGSNSIFAKKAAALPAQTIRRIWAVDNTTSGWFYGQHIYVHLNTAKTDLEMTRVLEDYYGGLFYADIDFSETGILFRNEIDNWTNAYNQTVDVTSLSNTDVYFINQNADNGKCPVSTGTAGMSNAQLAAVLEYYYTCTASYSDGYLAFPTVNMAFYLPSGALGKDAYPMTDPVGFDGNRSTTIGNKVAMMAVMYNKANQ